MEPIALIAIGTIVIGGGIVVFRTQRKVERSQSRDVLDEATTELQSARESVLGQVRLLEVRLLEHSRDLEAQLATRIAILDQLVAEADDRIHRLNQDLAEARTRDQEEQRVAERRAA